MIWTLTIDQRPPPPKEEHYCELAGCAMWGGFDFASSRNSARRWWCWEHYPYKAPGKPTAIGPLPSQA